MNIAVYVVAAAVLVGAFLYAARAIRIVGKSRTLRRSGEVNEADAAIAKKNLAILASDCSEKKKAAAFVALIECAYVLVHIITNQGESYDDERQTKFFCESLDHPGYIDALMAVEARPL